MSDPIYKNSTSIGNGKSDVIINTAGKVIIKVKDRYHILSYNSDDTEKTEEKEDEIITDLIILKTDAEVEEVINTLTKNSVIITAENTIYLYLDSTIYPLDLGNTNNNVFNDLTVNNKLILNGTLTIKSADLIQNLNAQYLNGNTSEAFIKLNLPQTISDIWTFANNVFFNKSISDSDQKTVLSFETSSLVIDNITVKNLTVTSEDNSEDNPESNEDIKVDYINAQTYLGQGSKIITSDEILKEKTAWNENWENGGDAIIELIIDAINNEKLAEHYTNEEDDSYSYYTNKLLDVSTNETFTSLISITEDAFYENDNNEVLYKTYYYRPKNVDTEWVNTAYEETSNAKVGIYDNWFNKNDYSSELSKFNGIIWNIVLSSNPYKIGDTVKYENNLGTVYGLVTRSNENQVTIITDGEDCDALYDVDSDEYDTCYINYSPLTGSVLLPAQGGLSVIGNITGINNSVFGTLNGYGFTSEGNCYLVNPSIALVNTNSTNYLKFSNDESFIGINKDNENFIKINNDGSCELKRKYMYNINNYLSFCTFGPITIDEYGGATIGTGETQITVSPSGTVTIPSAAVK